MERHWFKPRGYKHFDVAVGRAYADKICPSGVAAHSWLPLIHYVKRTKKYKRKQGKTGFKLRDIMYASHRDACILAKYAHALTNALDAIYRSTGLDSNVIAYRALGKANYSFALDAYSFAQAHAPCVVLCFDITGFFDNLDHAILKARLKRVLGVAELPTDWYAVWKNVTRYRYIERDALQADVDIAPRFDLKTNVPLATIAEIKQKPIAIHENSNKYGIPQGTPISSAFSNLYMLDVDADMTRRCGELDALYQRYSDDIVIVCDMDAETAVTSALAAQVEQHKLKINHDKTERKLFDCDQIEVFQYLGFNISPDGAIIRPSSLARQWRKAKRSIRRIRRVGEAAIAEGKAKKIYTKKLRRRFLPVGNRNFSSYARRAADAFDSDKIVKQVKRLERRVERELNELNQK